MPTPPPKVVIVADRILDWWPVAIVLAGCVFAAAALGAIAKWAAS